MLNALAWTKSPTGASHFGGHPLLTEQMLVGNDILFVGFSLNKFDFVAFYSLVDEISNETSK